MSIATVEAYTNYTVACVKFSGRSVQRAFAEFADADAFFNGAVNSGNYVGVFLCGYTDDDTCVELAVCNDCYHS